jgi:uncharacterized phage protein gp47/JayE
MMADAKEQFGSDLNDDEYAVIRFFYEPVAERHAELQTDLSDVLESTQLRYATGGALDLVCEKLGIKRRKSLFSKGVARFSRNTAATVDYTIPSGTIIQTDSVDTYRFVTTSTSILPAGQTSVDVNIKAEEGGVKYNVGANTLTVMPNPPTGIESVTNPADTNGGTERETDTELRRRAKKELGSGSRASQEALIRAARRVQGVIAASIFANDQDSVNTVDGLEPHEVEVVVEGGNSNEVAKALFEAKAAGDVFVGGVHGVEVAETVSLSNGQTKEISYSNPDEVQIYVDVDIKVTDEYLGENRVKDSIVSYIGGLLSSGNEDSGKIRVGDDVIFGEIGYAIRDVPGIFDVQSLAIGTTSNPTNDKNIEMTDFQVAISNALDDSITVNSTTL